jgi:hypothetical protein
MRLRTHRWLLAYAYDGTQNPAASLGSHTAHFMLPLTRADIADYLGLTLEMLSRQFSELKNRHLIEMPSSRDIAIPDIEHLAATAGLESLLSRTYTLSIQAGRYVRAYCFSRPALRPVLHHHRGRHAAAARGFRDHRACVRGRCALGVRRWPFSRCSQVSLSYCYNYWSGGALPVIVTSAG